ncbi:MAG: hemerythrin domain-containing protein [Bacillota bacterium]|nr:hemerythrin domain-containing protein [Bacillota bacterium]
MNGIELMVDEHKAIKRMLAVVRSACFGVMQGQEINYEDFATMIDFVRGYADAHHHGKEEQLLFNRMVEELGPAAQKLVTHGMLVEHDLGRLHMAELEKALVAVKEGNEEAKLDVIANAISYTHLLTRHIDKEDGVVYPFAERSFTPEVLEAINKDCETFEKEQTANGVQAKYIENLVILESKYM